MPIMTSRTANTNERFLVEGDKEVDEAIIAREEQREGERAKHNPEPCMSPSPDLIFGMR